APDRVLGRVFPMQPDETGLAPTPPPPYRPSWARNLATGFVILLCGIAIGGIGTAVFLNRDRDNGPRSSGRGPEHMVQRMQDEYGLSDDQVRQLQAVFKDHWEKLSAIRAEVQPRVDAEFGELQRTVESILTPSQAKEWRADFEQKRR